MPAHAVTRSLLRQRRGWYFYDWANSAFSTSVVTLFFGPYLTTHIARAAADARGFIYPLGIPVEARSYWEYVVAASVLLQALLLPVVGALADYSPRKKTWLGAFAYAGSAATIAMYWLDAPAYLAAGLLFIFANVALGASCVVYNSFLPRIARVDERDEVSSKGWGIGYIGGGLLLALNLLLYQNAGALGLSETMAVRISLGSAGLWWALFTVIPMLWLEDPPPLRERAPGEPFFSGSLRQLGRTISELRRYPRTMLFLTAYLVYNDAIQAVLALATQFGHDELKMPMSSLTLAILMVQFVAFLGAMSFNVLARSVGAKPAVMLALVAWTLALASIYVAVRTPAEFFALAAVVALIMGGSQALSRSLFSVMIPRGREAEYFGLYEIGDKGTSWLGPLVFGLTLQYTGSYRLAVLPLVVSFLIGLVILSRVDVRLATRDAGNAAPGELQ
jgi:MFS transporter, UMF1 family